MDQNAPRITNNNYAILRDCLAEPLILKSAPPAPPLLQHNGAKGPKGGRSKAAPPSAADRVDSKKKEEDQRSGDGDDAEELAEFIDVNQLFSYTTPSVGLLF